MSAPEPACRRDSRRRKIRRAELNGLDFAEVSDDQRRLTVHFLGKAPRRLLRGNVVIEGGRRVRGIRVVDVSVAREADPELDDRMVVEVDRPGDFSTYTLRMVEADARGRPTGVRLGGFDARYASLEFSFKAGCLSPLDCAPGAPCAKPTAAPVPIDYLARDYASFRQLILDRLALLIPGWTERHVPDLGIALAELMAYAGDHLSYYQDAVATEAYLGTARLRTSVRRHARLVDYALHEGCNARTWVQVAVERDVDLPRRELSFITGWEGMPPPEQPLASDDLRRVPRELYEVFEPVAAHGPELRFRRAHNQVLLYTWGQRECCLLRGATAATLLDTWTDPSAAPAPLAGGDPAPGGPPPAADARERALSFVPGDFLLLEEVIGARSGLPADADPAHRHVVRLTRVAPVVDELDGTPVLEVEWGADDALPFHLCVSSLGAPPACGCLGPVSVARGNVVLADHGETVEEAAGCVEPAAVAPACGDCGCPPEVPEAAAAFRAALQGTPLTFAEPLPSGWSAAHALAPRDPAAARPAVIARFISPDAAQAGADEAQGPAGAATRPRREPPRQVWRCCPDLLESWGDDRHFVVEVDDGIATLRFGDGEMGRAPDAGACCRVRYRVGNGPAGNVGAGAVVRALRRNRRVGTEMVPRNPVSATGGTPPQPLDEARLLAPYAFHATLERAVAAEDYARIAGRHPGVQRAAATLGWTGSWPEVTVALDPRGRAGAEPALLAEVAALLEPFRRIGHQVRVEAAGYVPLEVQLKVCVKAGYLRAHVLAALRGVLGSGTGADGTPGFFHPDRLSFGQGVYLSALVAAAQAVEGVDRVEAARFGRLFAHPGDAPVVPVLTFGPLEVPRLDADPAAPGNGILTLTLAGGR